jgi:TonB-linked SusC/RagA family outer membrane protein
MRLKLIGSLITALLFASAALAQQARTVSGTVTDSKDASPLAGVTVRVKGLNRATETQKDGTFTINVPTSGNTLVFSYIGYQDVEMPVSANMAVKLTASERNLNEVVVVGYGRAVKRDVTGSISRVTSKDVEDFPAPSFESAIQGKSAGVVIESGSGKLGQGIQVQIRGTSSISASSQPLYVIDGLPLQTISQSDPLNEPTNPLADINPNDIESIEILKDASAAAIYGARAANGVVLITTKKGRNNQKTTVQLDANDGFSNPTRLRQFLNAKQYVDLIEAAAVNDGRTDFTQNISGFGTLQDAISAYKSLYEQQILDLYSLGTDWRHAKVNTDWQNLLYRNNAQNRQVNLSATGGDEKTRFFVSGSYTDQDAIVVDNKFYRYGGRMNLEHTASDRLTLGIDISIDRSQINRISNDNSFSTPGQLVAQLPISPEFDSTGQLNKNTLYANGLYDAKFNSDHQVTTRTIGNAYAVYTIIPTLTFRSEFGADLYNLYQEAFDGKETIDGGGIGKGQLTISQSSSYNTNNYFTYTPKLNINNKLNAVLGMSYLQNDSRSALTQAEAFPSDAIKNLSGATNVTFANSAGAKYTFLSYFLRANYSYADKYLATLSVRTDGSSRFGPNNRYGWFPAASAGWVLSEEKFMKNVNFLNFLKLRASWGLTGNAEIGESNFLPLYAVSNYPGLPGFIPAQLGNPDLRWEKTAQTDIGLDFGILKNRVSGEIDVYKKHTTDLLLSVNIPTTTGYGSVLKNLGTMDNKGIEFTLNTVNIDDGGFKWTTSFNAAYNKNKVININGQIIQDAAGVERAVEGQPIGVFYMPKFVGVDKQTGDAEFLDASGKNTTDYDKAQRMVVGKSNPDWTGGFNNTFSYKGIDLSIFFTFVSGVSVYNAAGIYQTSGFGNGLDNQTIDLLSSWKKPGDVTDVPRASIFYSTGYKNSSRWLYDGSYIRLKNITLGYTLPASVLKAIKLSYVRVYITGVNLLTSTKYPGDPEINTNVIGNLGGSQDFYTIPQAKTITAGLSVRF